jgi:hypothetical protein
MFGVSAIRADGGLSMSDGVLVKPGTFFALVRELLSLAQRK